MRFMADAMFGVCYIMDGITNNASKLQEAFRNKDFQKRIQDARQGIEVLLLNFIEFLSDKLVDDQKIFRNVESRVKSEKSFDEKIFRKDYVHQWELPDKESEVCAFIADKLPDLIGFRISCFFQKDEKIIYDHLKSYYNDGNFGKDVVINFEENTRQANGHIIYKVTGKYKKEYGFEIQIKSVIHNLWGEVEHKTQYKTRAYDPNIRVKKDITEQLFNILQAADKQLVSIFNEKYTADQLLYALFFQQTKEIVKDKAQIF